MKLNDVTNIVIVILLTAMSAEASVEKFLEGQQLQIERLGTFGNTYPIAESDMLVEIKNRVKSVEWKKVFEEKKQERIKNYRPQNAVSLPESFEDKVYKVDMTYTLEMDIPDGKGGILYPQGYSFNPLDYVNYQFTLVIINGSDERQVQWFLNSGYNDRYRTKLHITDGNYWELSEKLYRPVYYLTDIMARRLQIDAVPSVIQQKGNMMEVTQIAIP